jgi:hypothetical protein
MPAPRDNRLQLLLTDEERKQFAAAAERSGLTLSSWMRQACRAAVLREKGLAASARLAAK